MEIDAAIIGAGPYGLSLAAHLRASDCRFRIFGDPMGFWLKHMPTGMCLKSDWFASDLFASEQGFTYPGYCRERNIPFGPGIPVRLDRFVQYGLAFQKEFVPSVENATVTSVCTTNGGFLLNLDNGDQVTAARVVVGVGMKDFAFIPPELSHLPPELLSHSSLHSDLGQQKGRKIAVVGGGSSAIDLAALLADAAADVELIARRPSLAFHGGSADPKPRSLSSKIKHPQSSLGPGWRSVFFAHMPALFRYLPQSLRLEAVRRAYGPAGGWFVRERLAERVPLHLGSNITRATPKGSKVEIGVRGADGVERDLACDHVVAATGYRVDMSRLSFLSPAIRSQLRTLQGAPVLSSKFESSVGGLYFVGLAAANTFGPVMRFVYGAGFAARQLSRELSRPRAKAAV